MNSFLKKLISVIIIGLIFGASGYFLNYYMQKRTIAYIVTPKLFVGFKDAAAVEKELKEVEDKWKKEYKILKDSLTSYINSMSKEYDRASPARQKELQDILSAKNQQINNFQRANKHKMDEMRKDKMKSVIKKINLYVEEYSKKNHYRIVFGVSGDGTIMYAQEWLDITDKIIEGLNERYK